MRTPPKIPALLLAILPILYPMAIVILLHASPVAAIEIYLHPVHLAVQALGLLTAWGLWEIRSWASWLFWGFAALVAYDAFRVVSHHAASDHVTLFSGSVAALVFVITYLARRRIRSEHRYVRAFRVRLSVADWAVSSSGSTSDISSSGCFIKLDPGNTALRVREGETINITVEVFTRIVRCEAIVTRVSRDDVDDITGVAVTFDNLTRDDRKIIATAIELIRKSA